VTLGLRAILLIVAIILFLIASGSNDWKKLVAIGLACTAGALLVGELGLGLRVGGRRRR
jgi:hypothetical protein